MKHTTPLLALTSAQMNLRGRAARGRHMASQPGSRWVWLHCECCPDTADSAPLVNPLPRMDTRGTRSPGLCCLQLLLRACVEGRLVLGHELRHLLV